MFGPVHIGMDETLGINRVCWENRIAWYFSMDFALLDGMFETRLERAGRRKPANYPVQAFYWLDGRAFQRYFDAGRIQEGELAYIHWFRRRPVPERVPRSGEAVVVTAQRLLVCDPPDLTPENMLRWNPPAHIGEHFFGEQRTRLRHYLSFLTGSRAFKKIWWKRKCFALLETRLKKLPHP